MNESPTRITAATMLVLGFAGSAFADSPVTFVQGNSRLLIKVNGSDFATYVWNDPTVKRPYFAHVYSPKGVQVTRTFPPVRREGRHRPRHDAPRSLAGVRRHLRDGLLAEQRGRPTRRVRPGAGCRSPGWSVRRP